MSSIKNFFAVSLGILGALILAPFIAFFGIMMLGLAFGLSILAAGAVTAFVRFNGDEIEVKAEAVDPQPQADPSDDVDMGAQAQPA